MLIKCIIQLYYLLKKETCSRPPRLELNDILTTFRRLGGDFVGVTGHDESASEGHA